jgi:hypothetical protein
MMGKIRGEASLAFSDKFYELILRGQSVDEAVASTRHFIKTQAPSYDAQGAAAVEYLRSNWPLFRLFIQGDARGAIRMRIPELSRTKWIIEDFVDRWNHRWDVWNTIFIKNRRLAVLWGDEKAGKSELLKAIVGIWARKCSRIIVADVSGSKSGNWERLLIEISAKAKESEFIGATELESISNSNMPRKKRIEAYLKALEKCAENEMLLIVIDGLGQWQKKLIEDTILPEICAPFLRDNEMSNVWMMITLKEEPPKTVWGTVVPGWKPIKVGNFPKEEWKRAVKQFEFHWLSKLDNAKQALFKACIRPLAESDRRRAPTLEQIRSFAKFVLKDN